MPLLSYPGTRGSLMHAAEIAHALKGKKSGRSWTARCPAHDDSDPSLSISVSPEGKTLIHCHAGCSQDQVIAALRDRGLWHADDRAGDNRPRLRIVGHRDDDTSRIEYAHSVWNAAIDPRDTLTEKYLGSRKLSLPPELRVMALRFHPACPWESNFAPCMIAAFRSIKDNSVTGVHRIRLDQPERWPKAERKMLGIVAGSAVKLDPVWGKSLVIGEGIETCMAARQLGFHPVWALGSSGSIKDFKLIEGVDELTILGERDHGANRNAADECCRRWTGRSVFHSMPPAGFKDFNDLIMERKNDAT
jgi:hypothetical protein